MSETVDLICEETESVPRQAGKTCLVVDDDDRVRDSLRQLLEAWGHDVDAAECGATALAKLRRKQYDVVLSDLMLPDTNGIEILCQAKKLDEHCVVLIMTGFASVDTAVEALEKGAFEYFVKPLNLKHLEIVLQRALEYRRLQLVAMEQSSDDMYGIVGISPKIKQVRAQIHSLAQTDLTVLILGETGTGKEVVANAIHETSRRRTQPFIAVNCGALPESLLESELFGHVKGAFTGALSDKAGLFESASGGTILLDEIDSSSAHTQAALLRILDYKELRPVGGTKTRRIDVRVLVASNKDLESLVGEGTFREDLFYRLISSVISLPPLRERVEDIPAFIECFASEWAEQEGKSNRRFSPRTVELLTQYKWPGNTRELRHAIHLALVSSKDRIIRPAALPDSLRQSFDSERSLSLDGFERDHLEKVLTMTNWNKSEAARLLEIRRARLYSLIKKHNLSPLYENDPKLPE